MNGSMQLNMPAVQAFQTGKKGIGESSAAGAGEPNFGIMAFAALLLGLTEQNKAVPGAAPDAPIINTAAQELPAMTAGLPPAIPDISVALQQAATSPLLVDSTGVVINDETNKLSADKQFPGPALFGDELGKFSGQDLERAVQTGSKRLEVINANRLEGRTPQVEAQGRMDAPLPETEFKPVAKPGFQDNLTSNLASNGLNLNLNQPGEVKGSAVKSPVLQETGFQAIAGQLIESSKATLTRGKSEVEIQLRPEYLGKVHLRLALEEGILSAKFVVENSTVGRLLENNLNQLRQSLQEQGLKFGQVNVEIGSGNFAQNHAQQFNQPKQHYSRLAEQLDGAREEPVKKYYSFNGINYLA